LVAGADLLREKKILLAGRWLVADADLMLEKKHCWLAVREKYYGEHYSSW
jgi:hypothetical protein